MLANSTIDFTLSQELSALQYTACSDDLGMSQIMSNWDLKFLKPRKLWIVFDFSFHLERTVWSFLLLLNFVPPVTWNIISPFLHTFHMAAISRTRSHEAVFITNRHRGGQALMFIQFEDHSRIWIRKVKRQENSFSAAAPHARHPNMARIALQILLVLPVQQNSCGQLEIP